MGLGDSKLSRNGLESSNSVRTECSSFSLSVPDPPIIIYFPVVTYKMARVVWAPPTKPNGIIIAYRVSYVLQNKLSNKQESYTEVNATVHEFTASGLLRETYYNFSVAAKTNIGWGNPAIVQVFTMKDRCK